MVSSAVFKIQDCLFIMYGRFQHDWAPRTPASVSKMYLGKSLLRPPLSPYCCKTLSAGPRSFRGSNCPSCFELSSFTWTHCFGIPIEANAMLWRCLDSQFHSSSSSSSSFLMQPPSLSFEMAAGALASFEAGKWMPQKDAKEMNRISLDFWSSSNKSMK